MNQELSYPEVPGPGCDEGLGPSVLIKFWSGVSTNSMKVLPIQLIPGRDAPFPVV